MSQAATRLRRQAHRAGFTILEILIAIVVLVLGIMGIIALFPTAIDSGNRTVEDSYAAAITQSVVDAVTVGLRESRYQYTAGSTVYTYFVFNHDGVIDQVPSPTVAADYADATKPWQKDWCILLPVSKVATANLAADQEPVFMYPTPRNTTATPYPTEFIDQRSNTKIAAPASQTDNLDDKLWRTTNEGANVPWVPAVYHLGRYRDPPTSGPALPSGMSPGDVRLEFRGDKIFVGSVTQETIAVDPYPTYGFAFTLQRARIDTAGGGPASDKPDGKIVATQDHYTGSLYQVRVMVFKNFDPEAAYQLRPSTLATPGTPADPNAVVPRTNVPVREFVTLIAL